MFGIMKRRARFQRDSVLRAISERSAVATLQRLSSDAENMSPAELRGYVRALALPSVWAEASQIAEEHNLSQPQIDILIAPAVEQTAHLVVRQFMSQPVVAMPAPHVRLRIAA